jgi:Tol biopolymer transport system component
VTTLTPMIGQSFGRYRIADQLGAGGMGEVYRALDTRLGRDVALKFLPPAFARDAERLARFEREARLLASLEHPNIGAIYGLEEEDGTRFLVLELVPGQTLRERLIRAPLTVEEAMTIGRQIAEAVEAAHEKGILHRDLKPENVKLTPGDRVKVLDFGLAKMLGDSSAPRLDDSVAPTQTSGGTVQGTILGTAAYMSPEQARGEAVDRRTDIWSFGCLLFEMLSGRSPFAGDTLTDTLAVVLTRDPDWALLPDATPPPVRELLRRCLQKDRRRRLNHMGDARLVLEETQSGAPFPAMAAPSPQLAPPAPAALERRPWLWAAAGAAIGALGATLLATLGGRPEVPAAPASTERRFTMVTRFAGIEAQPTLSPDGRSVAYVANRDSESDLWVGLVAGDSPLRLTQEPSYKYRPRWSPDGTRIAYAQLNGAGLFDIWTVPALGGPPRLLIANATEPAWSPDGRTLAYSDLDTASLWIADAGGGNPRQLTAPEPFMAHREAAFSRDGRRVAFVRRRAGGGPQAALVILDLGSGALRTVLSEGSLILSPVWSVGDRHLYFTSNRWGAINVWRVALDGGQLEQISSGPGDEMEIDLSTDGRRLVVASRDLHFNSAELRLAGADGKPELKWLTQESARTVNAPRYSPDGSRITYFSARRGVDLGIWVMNSDGSNPVRLFEDNVRVSFFPCWSGDGQALYYGTRGRGVEPGIELWRIGLSGGAPQKLATIPDSDFYFDISRQGRVVYRGSEGPTKVLDLPSGRSEVLPGVAGRRHAWSADGRRLAYAVAARRADDPEAGLWIHDAAGQPRQLFRGWALWHAWRGSDEVWVQEGHANLNSVLWRLRLDGSAPERVGEIQIVPRSWLPFNYSRFDVHPDGRRIAVEAALGGEGDIGMLEEIPAASTDR